MSHISCLRQSRVLWAAVLLLATWPATSSATEPASPDKAFIDGEGPGWTSLGEANFVSVNCDEGTWTWRDGVAHCTGQPVGVIRSQKQYENFELVAQWQHLESGGNSGIFVWTGEQALKDLPKGQLPKRGIEVQVLDLGFKEKFEKETGKKAEWFTCHGDVFPVGDAKMKPFEPTSPGGERSFPRKDLSKGVGHWNHYYVRCVNGEVRLWVNGEEVSGGTACDPRKGFLCLESEGAPVEFKGIKIRELP